MRLMLPFSQPQDLLRAARSAEQQGELGRALRLFKRAYAGIARKGDVYHPEVFTRLALAQQQAGRLTEGWQHLRGLLIRGCPGRNRYCHPAVRWLDQAAIYDKMRLLLQRAGENRLASVCGVWFYICRYQACVAQPRLGKPGALRSTRAIQSLLAPLLHRAQRDEVVEHMTAALHHALHQPASEENWAALEQRVTAVMFPEGYPAGAALADIPRPSFAPAQGGAASRAPLQGATFQAA